MRTRHKLTVAGALTLAAGTIGTGALITSHAMADSTPPAKGTVTVVSMSPGSDTAITCTYDDIDLPALSPGRSAGDPRSVVIGTRTSGEDGSTGTLPPLNAGTPGTPGTVQISGGEQSAGTDTSGAEASGTETSGTESAGPVTAGGSGPGEITTGVAVATGAGVASATPAPDGLPVIRLDGHDARPGTPEECAALRSTVPTP